ncbi:MAG: hypothetical protein WC544_02145 [Patescibacteria group bacterium]
METAKSIHHRAAEEFHAKNTIPEETAEQPAEVFDVHNEQEIEPPRNPVDRIRETAAEIDNAIKSDLSVTVEALNVGTEQNKKTYQPPSDGKPVRTIQEIIEMYSTRGLKPSLTEIRDALSASLPAQQSLETQLKETDEKRLGLIAQQNELVQKERELAREFEEENRQGWVRRLRNKKKREALQQQLNTTQRWIEGLKYDLDSCVKVWMKENDSLRTITKEQEQVKKIAAWNTDTGVANHHDQLIATLQSDEIVSLIFDRYLGDVLTPALEEQVKEKKLTRAEADEYRRLQQGILTGGNGLPWNATDTQRQEPSTWVNRIRELTSKCSYEFGLVQDTIERLATSHVRDGYGKMTMLITQERQHDIALAVQETMLQQPLNEETATSIKETTGRWAHIDNNSITTNQIDGFELWRYLRELACESGAVTPELIDRIENGIVRKLELEFKHKGESWYATGAADRLAKLNNPEALPYLLRSVSEQGSNHTTDTMVHAMISLLEKSDPRKREYVLAGLPESERQVLSLLQNKQSYLRGVAGVEHDGYTIAELLKRGGMLIEHEGLTRTLEMSGAPEDDVRDFYHLDFRGVESFEKLKNVAQLSGRDSKEIFGIYFNEIASHLSLHQEDTPDIIARLAQEMDLEPLEVYQKVRPYLHKANIDNPETALTVLKKIGTVTGIDKKNIINEYVDKFYDTILEWEPSSIKVVDKLAAELEVPREDLIAPLADRRPFLENYNNDLFRGIASPDDGNYGALPLALARLRLGEDEAGLKKIEAIYAQDGMRTGKYERERFLASLMFIGNTGQNKNVYHAISAGFDGRPESTRAIQDSINLYRTVKEIEKKIGNYFYSGNLLQGEHTPEQSRQELLNLFLKLGQEYPDQFVNHAHRNEWRMVLGDDLFNEFLAALPKDSDEKRNAFTHNEYDRTSDFINYMSQRGRSSFSIEPDEFRMATKYVSKFGLSKTPILYQYYKNILASEADGTPLPETQAAEGLTTPEALEQRIVAMKEQIFSEQPITALENLTAIDLEILSAITGKSTHRFDSGRPDISRIIKDFNAAEKQGEIKPSPPEHQPFDISTADVEIKIDTAKVQNDFDILSTETLEVIEHRGDVGFLKEKALDGLRQELTSLEETLSKKPDNQFIQKKLEGFRAVGERVSAATSMDALLNALLDIEHATAEKRGLVSVMREILLQRVFKQNYSELMANGFAAALERGVSPESILRLLNIHDDFIKDHVLNIDRKNEEHHWSDETWEKITRGRKSSKHVNLSKSFEPHIKGLREASKNFEVIESGKLKNVRAIPDRGLIGEMSGYLADVCYTAVYPLLKTHPEVVPYKFVGRDESTNEPKFIGSVLVFELEEANGDRALLVRGFDVPQEERIDIAKFIEQFMDQMATVAKQRGAKKVIVPGLNGATSNYRMTINHVDKNYRQGQQPVSLKQKFNFNGYDITDNCYTAREVLQ